ncbi:MAG: AAC(3)-I family aminoglycoside 3-N-acetyltransferase, partial [Kiloniellales bacterium]|nr:AAC(3)-I family aminoglycoside 3-N-acetyltransferase [Kiloniellales bacterium]
MGNRRRLMVDSSSFRIHRLRVSDLKLMGGLLALFAKVFNEQETYLGAVPGEAYLKNLLAKDHFIALAAIEEERVVGALVAYEL